jgi:hypothetical protein
MIQQLMPEDREAIPSRLGRCGIHAALLVFLTMILLASAISG